MSNKPGFFRQLKDTQNYSTKFLIVLFSPNWGNPYIVIFGDENVNAKQAQQDSIKRINAIKNVLNSDSVSPVSTSDNDPAPAPAPAPSPRRYRP